MTNLNNVDIKEYKTITGSEYDILQRVNVSLKGGWKLYGSIVVVTAVKFTQVMVKYNEKSKN